MMQYLNLTQYDVDICVRFFFKVTLDKMDISLFPNVHTKKLMHKNTHKFCQKQLCASNWSYTSHTNMNINTNKLKLPFCS